MTSKAKVKQARLFCDRLIKAGEARAFNQAGKAIQVPWPRALQPGPVLYELKRRGHGLRMVKSGGYAQFFAVKEGSDEAPV